MDTTESHWFSGYKEVKPKITEIGSIYEKGQIVEGFLKPLNELKYMGYTINNFNYDKSTVTVIHPCGKLLTIKKKKPNDFYFEWDNNCRIFVYNGINATDVK